MKPDDDVAKLNRDIWRLGIWLVVINVVWVLCMVGFVGGLAVMAFEYLTTRGYLRP